MRKFLTGAWPTIEQFPQFMAMNLKKLSVGDSPGEDLARRYLIHNIRVEQKHAEHWVDWARSVDLTLDDLQPGRRHRGPRRAGALVLVRLRPGEPAGGDRGDQLRRRRRHRRVVLPRLLQVDLRRLAARGDPRPGHALAAAARRIRRQPSVGGARDRRHAARPRAVGGARSRRCGGRSARPTSTSRWASTTRVAEMLHGSFDETASNASTLGALDAA